MRHVLTCLAFLTFWLLPNLFGNFFERFLHSRVDLRSKFQLLSQILDVAVLEMLLLLAHVILGPGGGGGGGVDQSKSAQRLG